MHSKAAPDARDFLENVVWQTYLGSPIYLPEPYCNAANKKKTSIHIVDSGLSGGCNDCLRALDPEDVRFCQLEPATEFEANVDRAFDAGRRALQ